MLSIGACKLFLKQIHRCYFQKTVCVFPLEKYIIHDVVNLFQSYCPFLPFFFSLSTPALNLLLSHFSCMCFFSSLLLLSLPSFPSGGEVATPRFTQYFHGSLSGLTIRPGRIETQKVISCLQACKEGLDINSLESLAKDIKVRGKMKMSLPIHTNTHTDSTLAAFG